MKITFLFLIVLMVSISPLIAAAPGETEVQNLLRQCVENDKRTPGMVIGWLDEKTSFVHGLGQDKDGKPLDGDTVFEIGSLSKTFTATLLQLMADRGELALDDPAQKFLPPSVTLPTHNGKVITLRHLATQTSGLPRMPTNFHPADPENPYADYSVKQLYAFLSGCKLSRDPGSQYEYSNLGVGLLGHILALKAGTNYEGLVLQEICRPLNMTSTGITPTPAMKARLAPGHNSAGVVVENWDIPTLAGAGALRSTANDMLKYLAANLGFTKSPLAEAMAKTHAMQHSAGGKEMSIGLAWHIRNKFGSELVWHNGGTGGYHSFIGFDPAKKQGVVVLSDSASDIDDVGWHLLNSEYPLSSKRPRKVAKVDYGVYGDYVGQYELAPSIRFTITREGDHLFAQLTGQQRFEVYPEDPTNFFYTVVDAQLTFERANGKVSGLVLHQNGRDQPARRLNSTD